MSQVQVAASFDSCCETMLPDRNGRVRDTEFVTQSS